MQNNALDQGRITETIDEATFRRAVALFQEENPGMYWAGTAARVRGEYIARAQSYTLDGFGPVVHEVKEAPTGTYRDPLADRFDTIERAINDLNDETNAHGAWLQSLSARLETVGQSKYGPTLTDTLTGLSAQLVDRLDVIEKLLYTVLDAVKAKNRTKA